MKEYITPELEIIELDMEGSVLTSSASTVEEARFGEPTDETD